MPTPTRTRTTYRPVSEAFRRQRTTGPRTRLRATSDGNFVLGFLAGAALVGLITFGLLVLDEKLDAQTSIPICTHEIADAGGICAGEPR